MKPTLITLLALQVVVEANKLRGLAERHLDSSLVLPDDYFLMSQIHESEDWCLTAVEGTKKFGNLGLKRCDFDKSPANQVWKRFIGDGKFHSKLDVDLCIVTGYSNDVFDGVRMRLADCSLDLTEFSYENEHITPLDDEDYCITNRGPNPDSSDTIHLKPCIDRADYKWTLKPATCPCLEESKKYRDLWLDKIKPGDGPAVFLSQDPGYQRIQINVENGDGPPFCDTVPTMVFVKSTCNFQAPKRYEDETCRSHLWGGNDTWTERGLRVENVDGEKVRFDRLSQEDFDICAEQIKDIWGVEYET